MYSNTESRRGYLSKTKTGYRRGAKPLLKNNYSPSPYQGEGDTGGEVTRKKYKHCLKKWGTLYCMY